MARVTGPLLLAGTRVTGPSPHLGTFYGWIRPVAAAARTMQVCVLVADLQSLDTRPFAGLEQDAARLTDTLRRYLPDHVPVIRESHIPSLPLLALHASALFARHHLRRIAPLRRLTAAHQPIPLPTALYPAMMIANVLAFDATHVLAKPEGRFQHHDVLNDVLHRAHARYGWTDTRLTAHPKPTVNLPSADGQGPMKRDRPGALTLDDADPDSVMQWTRHLPSPTHLPAEQRPPACRVVLPIWTAIADQKPHRLRVAHACATGALTCGSCKTALARAISTDMNPARDTNQRPSPERVAERAEHLAQALIARACGTW